MSETHPKLKGLLWIGGTALVAALVIFALPFFAKHVPWSFETKMAGYLETGDHFEPCTNAAGKLELKKVVDRLYPQPEFPIDASVISGKTVNAFAFLGGKIYIYDGLLQKAESPEELAGVLAHEIEHVRHRHIIEGVFVRLVTIELLRFIFDPQSGVDPNIINSLVNLRFSRDQEDEADRDGLKRLQRAHVNVMGFAQFFKREDKAGAIPALLSDHPSSGNRSELAQSYFRVDTTPVLTVNEWKNLKKICEK
jgi:Zn-dependent protease with chaperone function